MGEPFVNDDVLGLAALLLLAGPLVGALLLWVTPRRRAWRTALTLVTLVLPLVGLGIAASAVLAAPETRLAMPLDFGLSAEAGHALWTLAPAAISLLFVAIAIRARSLPLVGLALVQMVLVLPTTVRDLGESSAAESGLVLSLDPLALALLAVSVIVGGLIVVFTIGYEPVHLRHTGQDAGRTNVFLGWLLIFLAAMHLLVLADDLRMLAVGWELTTLCSFVLIGFDREPVAGVAARRALAYNLLGGAALAAGLWLAGPGATLASLLAEPTAAGLTAVLALFAIAAATKSALAPFHPWLLGAMVAAAPVSALLHASTMVKAGSYLLLRLSPAFADAWIGLAVTAIGAFSFAGAALLALRERDLKRVLALSTVASLGMIAAAAGMGSPLALAAGIVFLVLHAVAKALAFLVVGSTEQETGTRDLEALVGLGRSRPSLAGPLLLAAASMALPPFGIAVAKWALLLESGSDALVVPVLAVGAAANVALWASVAGRILVRRAPTFETKETVRPSQWVAIVALTAGSAAGLVLAGPLAALLGDPAAAVAFGSAAPLASGWQATALGGIFPVLPLALVTLGVVGGAVLYTWRQAVSPAPYLSGLNVAAGAGTQFRGPLGTRTAASGGFYWGGALGDASNPGSLRRLVEAIGWVGVACIGLIGLLGWVGAL
jgi:ech hydrogenase subunit A